METPLLGPKKPGSYLGTEINGKWWRRYSKEGLLACGAGEWKFGDDAFLFHRFLTKEPIRVPYKEIAGAEIGKSHSGRWGLRVPVIKIIVNRVGLGLSMGFCLFRTKEEAEGFVRELLEKGKGTDWNS